MTDDKKDERLPQAEPVSERTGHWVELRFGYMLSPERWTVVYEAILRFQQAAERYEDICTARRTMAEVAFGRFALSELTGSRAGAQQFPPGPAATELIALLRSRRSEFFQQRGKPEPALFSAHAPDEFVLEVERHTADPEEGSICEAIEIVLQYADGGPLPFGELEPGTHTAVSALLRASEALKKNLAAVENMKQREEREGKIPVSAYRALMALKAAQVGLELAWEPPTGYDELREEEVVRVLLGLEGVRPKIDRRLMAAWMTEVGLANYDERSLNTLIHRLRRSGRLRVPQRKKHTRVE